MSHTCSPIAVSATPLTVYHRGFAISVHRGARRGGPEAYGYVIRHDGLVLHASEGTYRSASRAESTARRFVDDAVGAFDLACVHLDAGA